MFRIEMFFESIRSDCFVLFIRKTIKDNIWDGANREETPKIVVGGDTS